MFQAAGRIEAPVPQTCHSVARWREEIAARPSAQS
jgi:hypothetical protein